LNAQLLDKLLPTVQRTTSELDKPVRPALFQPRMFVIGRVPARAGAALCRLRRAWLA